MPALWVTECHHGTLNGPFERPAMKTFFSGLKTATGHLIRSIRVFFLFQFRLKPRIVRMKRFVNRIVSLKRDLFPAGRSLFIFSGKGDNLYFIVMKENALISVTEVYDDVLNRIPERYRLLPKIEFSELFLRT